MTDLVPNAYFHQLNPFAIHFGGSFGIRWYGLAYLAGFLAAYLIILHFAKRGLSLLKPEVVGDFVFTAALGTVVGGRLGYCIFYSPELFTKFSSSFPFWGVLAINEGGMASHGGIIGILVACSVFGRRHGVSPLHLFDLTTLGGTIGIFFGRIANFVNGELVGRPVESAVRWAVKFPQDMLLWPSSDIQRLTALKDVVPKIGISPQTWEGWAQSAPFDRANWANAQRGISQLLDAVQSGNTAIIDGIRPILLARHPSQIYEALLEGLFLFICLVLIWSKPRKPGVIAGWFFVLYSVVRIVGEQFRMPDAQIGFQLFGLTRGQWLSVVMLLLGMSVLLYWSRRAAPLIGGWARRNNATPSTEKEPA